MQPKEWLGSRKGKIITVSVAILLVIGGLYFLLRGGGEKKGPGYEPEIDLPAEYGIIMDEPADNDSMMFSALLSSLVVDREGDYHPMFILDEDGALDDHQMDTIQKMGLDSFEFLLFTKDPETPPPAANQVNVMGTYDMGPLSLARFKGFDGLLTVSSYEEALWAASIARKMNLVMVGGDRTYGSQEEAWRELHSLGVPFDYVMVVNPLDGTTEMLQNSPGYDPFDDQFHIPAISAVAGEVAAYRSAYVLTQYEPSQEDIGYMDHELNQRAIGYYLGLKEAVASYGLPKYVTLVGSASAVPQFQLPDETNDDPNNVEGDLLVSSDVAYGFLGEDPYYMDSAVGRLVNLNVQGMSNQIVRTYLYQRHEDVVSIDYQAGTQDVNWRSHGTSFSGYEITYERGQVTPARFWCRDAEDEGMSYDYIGPSNIGRDILIGDGVDPKGPDDMNNAMEASGFVAYRGHGSEYGSLYMVPYAISGDESAVLRGEEVRELLLPPQVGFWVACMNAKIHGAGWWKPAEPIDVTRTFALNYLYGGAVIAGGATEVSFSNIAQDATSATEEWLPGFINPNWDDGNYEWDLNDAWFAFFWDAVLNNEADYGTAGEALRWAENRYIHNPIRDHPVSPFIQEHDDPDWAGGLLGAHWKEVSMFAIYGDPAFSPHPNNPGQGSYRPWTNGPDDTGEP
ncbi:MAG: C25 family cysteine peptidase [Thermoplasmatota archaeon]